MSELARHICMAANLGMRDDAEHAIDSIVAERDALTREVEQLRAELFERNVEAKTATIQAVGLRAELQEADLLGRREFEKHRAAWQAERDEVIRLRTLLTRRWPIVQAAFAYTDSTADPTDTPHEDALLDAVNDYRSMLGTTPEATDAQ